MAMETSAELAQDKTVLPLSISHSTEVPQASNALGGNQLVAFEETKPQLILNLQNQQTQPKSASSPMITIQHSSTTLNNKSTTSSNSGNSSIGVAVEKTSPALASTATILSATTQAATAFSGSSVAHQNLPHNHQQHQPNHQSHHSQPHHHQHAHHRGSHSTPVHHGAGPGNPASGPSGQQQQPIEKLSRPMAFDKMEALVREMQDPETGVPVRQQKMFLTSIPYAFMGYDLIEWLMDHLLIEESEALNIANQLCLHGYFFPVNDSKTLTVKDDSSLYRFQTPYYWPWQHKAPDNVEYAIYLAKRSLRNKQRHALEDYEAEALASLHKNLKGKWDFISMQAEEQVRLAKERKKGDKIVGDSQERAYWRVHRPPPTQFTPLEPCPVPSRDRQGGKPSKKKTVEDMQREVDFLKKSLNRTRMKMSQACESLVAYSETFSEYDFFLQPVLPSNPWVTDDVTFWQLNNTFVDIPTEKRVKRWAISIEELVSDPTGLQEFTTFLEKEYSHENIRFWIAVNRLRRSAHSQVSRKVNEIYEEFLKPGAPCEINIDSKTMESVLRGLKSPSRFTFDSAAEHIYMLLLKKDCYPRFIRSEHYKRMLETGIQPAHKKRFFNFGGVSGAKKKMTAALSSQTNLGDTTKQGSGCNVTVPPPGSLSRRRGSDRSLTGSAHELAVISVNKDVNAKVPHSHSQSNLSEIPYRGDLPPRHKSLVMESGIYGAYGLTDFTENRHTSPLKQEVPKLKAVRLESTAETSQTCSVCPWDEPPTTQAPVPTQVRLSVCPWDLETDELKPAAVSPQRLASTSSDNSDTGDRFQRNLGIRHQNTVDSGEAGMKRLIPNMTEQRRASVSFSPSRTSEYCMSKSSLKTSITPSPTVACPNFVSTAPFSVFGTGAVAIATLNHASSNIVIKDPPSTSSDADLDEELKQLSISEKNSESSTSELHVLATPAPTPTPPLSKITPPLDNEANSNQNLISIDEIPKEICSSDAESNAEASPVGAQTIDTEVAGVINEVQIELIETGPPDEQSASPQSLIVSMPAIHIEEDTIVESLIGETTIYGRTLTPSSSCPGSPDKMLEVIVSPKMSESISDLELNPLPSPPSTPAKSQKLKKNLPSSQKSSVEKDAQLEVQDCFLTTNEELSPTTEEYQEGLAFERTFNADRCSYNYGLGELDSESQLGYIPPAPTPAPSIAPLAEMDDTADDDFVEIESTEQLVSKVEQIDSPQKVEGAGPAETISSSQHMIGTAVEDLKKKRKKRNSDSKKQVVGEEKASTSKAVKSESDLNTVCPWEDENVSTSDGTFVKTYATLGYL